MPVKALTGWFLPQSSQRPSIVGEISANYRPISRFICNYYRYLPLYSRSTSTAIAQLLLFIS